jgi:hypothetical protein
MSDRGVGRDHGCRILVGWVLVEALVQTVVVEVPSKFVEDGEGVSLVVSAFCRCNSSRTLRTNRSA